VSDLLVVRIPAELRRRLAELAARQRRPEAELTEEALSSYLIAAEWQAEADAQAAVKEVKPTAEWLDSWVPASDTEIPPQ
jgi:predicted transcriptional regulator